MDTPPFLPVPHLPVPNFLPEPRYIEVLGDMNIAVAKQDRRF
jgi:hypothetical protein